MKTFCQYIKEDLAKDLEINQDADSVLHLFMTTDPIDIDVVAWLKTSSASGMYNDIDTLQAKMYMLQGSQLKQFPSLEKMTIFDRMFLIVSDRMSGAHAWHINSKTSTGSNDHVIGVVEKSMKSYFSHEFSHAVNSVRSGGKNETQLHRATPDDLEKSQIDYLTNHEEVDSFFHELLEFLKQSSSEEISDFIRRGNYESNVRGIIDYLMSNWDRGPELKAALKLNGKESRRNSFYRRIYRLIHQLEPRLGINKTV